MLIVAGASLLGSGVGCATTVQPPAKPIDPVPVFLTDYGVHSSLMLPTPDGRYVEYSFGDFGYAALNKGGPHNALGALLVSGQAGIGRRYLTVRPGEETPRPAYAPKSFQRLYAERFQVYAMVKEMDRRFRSGEGDPVHNNVTDNVFVKDDTEHYSFANNCNHMTARMLRELGCEVKGNPGVSSFKIVGAQQLPPKIDTGPVSATGSYAQSAQRTAPAMMSAQRSAQSVRPALHDASPAAREASFTKLDTN
jgi:hypothetical protein